MPDVCDTSGPLDPQDLAIGRYPHDDALLERARRGEPALELYRVPDPVVVLGRGSRPEVELELDACRADAVPLLRRSGGGCSVVLDPGNVIVSLALPVAGLGGSLAHFEQISRWLAAALERCGVPGVYREGASDLVLAGRKIGGACIHRSLNLLHYSTTLLVTPRVELMARYLRHPPREPAYRQGRSHADFVGRLLPHPTSPEQAEQATSAWAERLRSQLHLTDLSWNPAGAASNRLSELAPPAHS